MFQKNTDLIKVVAEAWNQEKKWIHNFNRKILMQEATWEA
jgi:hypothetical protein